MSLDEIGTLAALAAFCYVLGSLPFGFLAARLKGIDILRTGSGATGATNVMRVLGPAYALPVLLMDVGKGAFSAYLGLRYLGMGALGALVGGAAAVAGHNWSVFLKFKGGKGVATTAGVVLVAYPRILAVALAVFAVAVAATRYVSLGSILGAWAGALASLAPEYGPVQRIPVFVLVLLITLQHRSNVKRLLQGKERKLGERVTPGDNSDDPGLRGAGEGGTKE